MHKKTTNRKLNKLTLKKDIFDTAMKDNLKSSVDIISLFAHFGVELKKVGKSYVGSCPWHKDDTPSLSVDKSKGLYNCFGCGESGDVFTLVEKMKGLAFTEAVTYLQNFTNMSLDLSKSKDQGIMKAAQNAGRVIPPLDTTVSPSLEERDRTEAVSLNTVKEYYIKSLQNSREALAYLKKRGIPAELVNRFGIGYSNGTLKEKVGEAGFRSLQSQGIFTEKKYELMSGCITVPLTDEEGRVLSFYGRKIDDSGKMPSHRYLSGDHKAVFNEKAFGLQGELVLAESVIDALSLISMGVQNVSCIYGTNGLTKLHIAKLHKYGVQKVILALDNDEPGKKAAEKCSEILINEGFTEVSIWPVGLGPSGAEAKDWNELLLSGKITKEAFNALVLEAPEQSPGKSGRSFRKTGDGLVLTHEGLVYTVKAEKGYKQSIKCTSGEDIYYDRVDLYSARSRASFAGSIAKLFETESRQVEKDLIALLEYLEDEKAEESDVTEIVLTEEDKALGMTFLTSPAMFDEIVEDTETLGYVGEETNKKLMYLAATSRLLDDPISILILSESGSGKSYLVDTIKKLMPPEDVIDVTSLSDQALNYMGDLEHKFMSLSEAVHKDVIEHQLREMVSNKELRRLVTKKDEAKGTMKAEQVSVKAIVSLVMSSTNYDVNPENASRSFVIQADESKEQTQRIYQKQREKYTFERQRIQKEVVPEIIRKHQAAQRMLNKYMIQNDFNRYLDFPDNMMRFRRDQDRFIDLIAVVCFLRQYQKEVRERSGVLCIDCDLTDYAIARELLIEGILSHSKDDMPAGTKRLFDAVRDLIADKADKRGLNSKEVTVIQKEIREYSGLGHEFVKKHMRTLVEYEYIEVVSGRANGTRRAYRLREDRDIQTIRIDLIPTAEEMKKRISRSKQQED
jgi:DNA primase catalytic core